MTFLHIIKQSDYLHDAHNKPLYIYTNNGTIDNLIAYIDFDWNSLANQKVYTTDLMYLKYLGINLPDVEDVSFIHYYLTNKPLERESIPVESFYKRLYPTLNKLHVLIPYSFWYDHCRELYEQCKVLFVENTNQFYKKQLDVFHKIESNGIMYKHEITYSKYNFFTTTGRPSNRFGGINFAALNKKDGSRGFIKSKYEDGILVEVDFESYHPRLIAELINYDLPENTNVYEYFARYYNNTNTPTTEEIKRAKEETFRKIYGALNSKNETVPYFKKAAEYVDSLWKEFRQNRQIQTPISGRTLYYDNYEDVNSLVLFNYLIQLTETERNVVGLYGNPLLDNIILYTYDAVLLDIRESDLEKTIEDINTTISSTKYPTKIKAGYTYDEMRVWKGKPIFIEK